MPEPRAMNISVFLDEVMAINGPLSFLMSARACACVMPCFFAKYATSYGSLPETLLRSAEPRLRSIAIR
jgi:hypothetical protein